MTDFVTSIPNARCIYTKQEVDAAYKKMAEWATKIVQTSVRPTMLIGPMQGALLVMAEMLRRIEASICYKMVKVSYYDAVNNSEEDVDFECWPITNDNLCCYNFIVVDDVGETLRTYEAMRKRLAARGASVRLLTLVDKPVPERASGLKPDYAPLTVGANQWIIGEGMNTGEDFLGQACRKVPGIWVMNV